MAHTLKNQKETQNNKPKKEEDKLVKNINYLNSQTKTKINTDAIDKAYSSHDLSFGTDPPNIITISRPIDSKKA